MRPARIRITRDGVAYITLRDLFQSEKFKATIAEVRRCFGKPSGAERRNDGQASAERHDDHSRQETTK